jgi:sugar lactone lactonase YvrE
VPRPLAPLLALCAALCLWFAASASAADSVFWTSYEAGQISAAPLVGGSGLNISFAPLAPQGPLGSVADPATGKLYWADFGNNTIGVSNLDGSGSTTLNTAGATVSDPTSLAIDPAAGKLYWMNYNANKISWAALDGTGGGDLNTTGAPMSLPRGVAVYPAAGRIYWANSGVDSIAYANLDGSGGGGEIPLPAGDLEGPDAVAIDAASATIYWTNSANGTIGHASLDGLGAGLLSTAPVVVGSPTGVAIDAEAGRLYWADEGSGGIFSAALGGGDARRLDTGTAQVSKPSYPFLFKAPQPAGFAAPPALALVKQGATLTCAQGSWKADLPESLLFRAPQSFAYSWTLNGVPLAGATSPTLTATAAEGTYSCQVTATNGAGSTTAGGGSWGVPAEEPGPHRPLLQILKLKRAPKQGTATVFLTVSGPGAATLTGKQVVRRTVVSSGAGVVKVKVATKGKARKKLVRTGKVKVAIKLGFRATEGAKVFISRAITLSRKRHARVRG